MGFECVGQWIKQPLIAVMIGYRYLKPADEVPVSSLVPLMSIRCGVSAGLAGDDGECPGAGPGVLGGADEGAEPAASRFQFCCWRQWSQFHGWCGRFVHRRDPRQRPRSLAASQEKRMGI